MFLSTSACDYAISPPASFTPLAYNANQHHPPRIDFPASLSRSSWSLQSSPDPVSPISFSSPTSSNKPPPDRRSYHEQGYCPSLEFSAFPSWETSFNTQIGDFESLRVEYGQEFIWPEPMLNPSRSQPFNTFSLHNNNDSSTELDVPTIPMLTTLSLPGSLDSTLDFSRRNSPAHRHGGDNLHTQESSLSSSAPSVSEVTSTAYIRGLEFPSPPLTLSPFITAPPPESPIINLPVADSSTVEYASAVVSSSWGPDISIRPDYPMIDTPPSVSSPASETPDSELHQECTREAKPPTTVSRFKTLGRKMKKLLLTFPSLKHEGSISNERFERSQGHFRNSTSGVGGTSAEASLRTEDSFIRIEDTHMLPVPPGLSGQNRSVIPETSSSSLSSPRSHIVTSPPVIRITSSSCSYRTPSSHIPDEHTNDLALLDDSVRTLEIEARPKTLEEIKSKRRFSLSILSNTPRSASQPSSSIVAVAHTRQRPRSTLVLPAASSSSISGGNDIQGLGSPSNIVRSTLEEELRMEAIPETSTAQGISSIKTEEINVNKKKYRRFSLPALSHLAKFA
ncbi:hypothetical protein C0993_007577 [Termitomyces sp. T159_Od127]|nr:hypothetical protein C0993_007577 [Termitomyces sp. T159_Od127]